MLRSTLLAAVLLCATTGHAATATGLVYNDLNNNGARDADEPGLPGVRVSNGVDIVTTDANGAYRLEVDDDTILFVLKPTGWAVPVSQPGQLPQHYYIHKPEGSPELKYPGVPPTGPLPDSVDFPLTKTDEATPFKVLTFGDTQSRDQREVDYMSHDIIEELVGSDAAFGATLGDLVFDDLDVFDGHIASIGLIGVPWHHVIGNHDINFDAKDPRLSDETYERYFGPSWYAFDYAGVHFLVLNNVWWKVDERKYTGRFGEDQLEFVKNDLAGVPNDTLVVAFMHIPLTGVEDRAEFLAMLSSYENNVSLSAHWHRQGQFLMGADDGWQAETPHHHIVHGTVCGPWWTGPYNELGIPQAMMMDGVPNGYGYLHFDGSDYRFQYRAAGRPADYQMNLWAPEVVKQADAATTEVLANVFAGNERNTVHMKFGREGDWTSMTRFDGMDPYYTAIKERQRASARKMAQMAGVEDPADGDLRNIIQGHRELFGLPLASPRETPHLWKATLPADAPVGYHVIHVRTTDEYGVTYQDRRIVRIEE